MMYLPVALGESPAKHVVAHAGVLGRQGPIEGIYGSTAETVT